MAHVFTLVLGHYVGRQLALYGEATRTSPYRYYLSVRDLQMTVGERAGADGEIRELIRREWANELADGGRVDRDELGWFIDSVRSRYARWDGWVIGWRGLATLVARPGRPVIAESAWYRVASTGSYEHAVWVNPPQGGTVRGEQARLGDLDLDAIRDVAPDRRPSAIVHKGAWWNADGPQWWEQVDGLLRGLPEDTLVTAVDCHR
jgi:hypothetical protein